MPDINEGLEIDGKPQLVREEGDVNTQGGFEAALGRAVSGEVETPEPAEPETPDTGTEEEEPEPEPEESAAEWRARYEELHKVMGRQTNELGELRAWASEQQQYQPPPPQQLTGPLDMEALIEENGGQKVIDWAIDNNPEMIDEAARLWALSGDPEGNVFYADYRAEQARLEQTPQPQPSEPDPALQNLALERKLADTWAEQRASDPQFATYEPGIGAALSSEETPMEIKMMLLSGDPDHMRQAVGFLKPYAQLEAIKAGVPPEQSGTTGTPPEPAPQDTPAEAARREQIRRTAIVTGSQRLQTAGAQPETGELDSAQRIERFKQAFEEVPSTDISSGLTINGQPVVQPRPSRS